jgi:hypothetical protein
MFGYCGAPGSVDARSSLDTAKSFQANLPHDDFGWEEHVNAQRRDALLKEYGEVSNLFRTLTDIRFRLLGILPIASAVTAALGARSQNGGEIGVPLALALFGLAAAIGVVTYNARNDQLYNELVGRAAAIERSVGLPDGAFSNRPRPWLRYKLGRWTWHIDHGHGIATIYAATIAFWLFLSIDASLHLIGLPPLPAGGAEASAHSDKVFDVTAPPATLPALGTTALVLGGAWWLLRRQRRARDRALRSDVRAAMDLLAAFDNDLTRLKDHPQFLKYCAGALGGSEATVSARAEFYSELAPEALGYYALTGSKLHKAASLVSLLTDLPPLWVFDLMLNRRGTQRPGDWTSPLAPALRDATLASIGSDRRRIADG